MISLLKIPEVSFTRIRNEQNQKIENYIKRLNQFWTLLITLCDKEFLKEEGEVKFKSTYVNRQRFTEAGFKSTTIDRYIAIFEHDGYLTREYKTYDNGLRKIGNSLYVTLHPDRIIPQFSEKTKKNAILKELANSKAALVLNNLKMANA